MSSISAADPTSALVAMTAQARSTDLATLFVRQQATQDRGLADMLAQAAAPVPSAPPPGQGTLIDRLA